MIRPAVFLSVIATLSSVTIGLAQAPAAPAATPQTAVAAPPPPATKVEAFRPAAGSLVTLGYNDLGTISYSIAVDARELTDARGTRVRGVVVTVLENQYRNETAMLDSDELPELIRGIDALLAVKTNPTHYENFEVRYTTKGELRITAFGSGDKVSYAVRAGRVTTASTKINEEQLRKLRGMFDAANQLFASQPAQ
jgi:hypothetical protein